MLTTLKDLTFEEALDHIDAGAAFIDLRDIHAYLDVHIPGSIALLYEAGPGMASRARDCIPLDLTLILLDLGTGNPADAAASLRGKGFDVVGKVSDGINRWARSRGAPASTEVIRGGHVPSGRILDVGDPGVGDRRHELEAAGVTRIPIERLWSRIDEVRGSHRVVIVAASGVRAAIAVGLLERAGVPEIVFWRTISSPSRA